MDQLPLDLHNKGVLNDELYDISMTPPDLWITVSPLDGAEKCIVMITWMNCESRSEVIHESTLKVYCHPTLGHSCPGCH
jgi:hypothetical protein